jgi:hypothetical protein
MLGPTIAPTEVKSGCKYWLRSDGAAFEVKEHLAVASEIQDASDEYDSRRRWGYDDMFRLGWVRIGEDISAVMEKVKFLAAPPPAHGRGKTEMKRRNQFHKSQ